MKTPKLVRKISQGFRGNGGRAPSPDPENQPPLSESGRENQLNHNNRRESSSRSRRTSSSAGSEGQSALMADTNSSDWDNSPPGSSSQHAPHARSPTAGTEPQTPNRENTQSSSETEPSTVESPGSRTPPLRQQFTGSGLGSALLPTPYGLTGKSVKWKPRTAQYEFLGHLPITAPRAPALRHLADTFAGKFSPGPTSHMYTTRPPLKPEANHIPTGEAQEEQTGGEFHGNSGLTTFDTESVGSETRRTAIDQPRRPSDDSFAPPDTSVAAQPGYTSDHQSSNPGKPVAGVQAKEKNSGPILQSRTSEAEERPESSPGTSADLPSSIVNDPESPEVIVRPPIDTSQTYHLPPGNSEIPEGQHLIQPVSSGDPAAIRPSVNPRSPAEATGEDTTQAPVTSEHHLSGATQVLDQSETTQNSDVRAAYAILPDVPDLGFLLRERTVPYRKNGKNTPENFEWKACPIRRLVRKCGYPECNHKGVNVDLKYEYSHSIGFHKPKKTKRGLTYRRPDCTGVLKCMVQEVERHFRRSEKISRRKRMNAQGRADLLYQGSRKLAQECLQIKTEDAQELIRRHYDAVAPRKRSKTIGFCGQLHIHKNDPTFYFFSKDCKGRILSQRIVAHSILAPDTLSRRKSKRRLFEDFHDDDPSGNECIGRKRQEPRRSLLENIHTGPEVHHGVCQDTSISPKPISTPPPAPGRSSHRVVPPPQQTFRTQMLKENKNTRAAYNLHDVRERPTPIDRREAAYAAAIQVQDEFEDAAIGSSTGPSTAYIARLRASISEGHYVPVQWFSSEMKYPEFWHVEDIGSDSDYENEGDVFPDMGFARASARLEWRVKSAWGRLKALVGRMIHRKGATGPRTQHPVKAAAT